MLIRHGNNTSHEPVMAPTKKTHTKPKSLSHGRPRTIKRAPSLSSKATRTLIRTHHTLEKRRLQALATGDLSAAAKVSEQIEAQGGLEKYQLASLLGQNNERGGDSSRILMDWMRESQPELKIKNDVPRFRLLEVGALSTTNACSQSGIFEIERIDLNSQAEGIQKQDFMERPLPSSSEDQFDIISLSLVLNYVPDSTGKGEMLKRTLKFLREQKSQNDNGDGASVVFPCLFLVLPAACVTNSRYMDEERLEAIMHTLGYLRIQRKLSNKLVYYLWKARDIGIKRRVEEFKKVEIRSGKSRNNFSITLK